MSILPPIPDWLRELWQLAPEPPPSQMGVSRPRREVDYERDIPTRLTLKKQLRQLENLRQNKKS